jgi:hypothetical protein
MPLAAPAKASTFKPMAKAAADAAKISLLTNAFLWLSVVRSAGAAGRSSDPWPRCGYCTIVVPTRRVTTFALRPSSSSRDASAVASIGVSTLPADMLRR